MGWSLQGGRNGGLEGRTEGMGRKGGLEGWFLGYWVQSSGLVRIDTPFYRIIDLAP